MKANNLTNEEFEKIIVMEFPALAWLAILGNVTLALRHPQNIGASRPIVLSVIERMEKQLMINDIIDQEDIDSMRRVEDQSRWVKLGMN